MNVLDIIGPIMVGPSSSHTAGAVRIGQFCNLLAHNIKNFEITFFGSFAKTYKGHCTDRAVIGGILGYKPDDERIKYSISNANSQGYNFKIFTKENDLLHPNTVKISWIEDDGTTIYLYASSIGGGNIDIFDVCGYNLHITDVYDVLICPDLNNYDVEVFDDILLKRKNFFILQNRTEVISKLIKLKLHFRMLNKYE